MVLPFVMLAVLFRGIENFKMFDMVNLLTSGGPGSATELASITLKREAFEKWRTGYSSAFAVILVRGGVRHGQHLRQGAERREEPLSAIHAQHHHDIRNQHGAFSVVEPTVRHARWSPVRWWSPSMRWSPWCRWLWIILTGVQDTVGRHQLPAQGAVHAQSIEGYCNLFTTRSAGRRPSTSRSLPPADAAACERQVARRHRHGGGAGPSNYIPRFVNSLIIAFGSTVLSVGLRRDGGLCLQRASRSR